MAKMVSNVKSRLRFLRSVEMTNSVFLGMRPIIDEYHNLLDSDASIEGVDRTITLIENILGVQWTEQISPQICRTEWQDKEVALFQQQLDNDFKQYWHFYAMKCLELGQVQKIASTQAHRVLKSLKIKDMSFMQSPAFVQGNLALLHAHQLLSF